MVPRGNADHLEEVDHPAQCEGQHVAPVIHTPRQATCARPNATAPTILRGGRVGAMREMFNVLMKADRH